MKGLLVALVVLAALAVGADLVAARVAEGVIADQAQRSGGLAQRPDVDVRGFPFLTQAVGGRYEEVRLRTSGDVGGADVEALDVRLLGVRLPLADAVSGDVAQVPVDGLRGDVLLSYASLTAEAPEGLTVSAAGDRLRVTGSVEVLGQTLTASALSDVAVAGDAVVVRAQEFETGRGALDGALARALGDRFDFRVPVSDLPYGLALTDVRTTAAGLAVSARSGPTVLQR